MTLGNQKHLNVLAVEDDVETIVGLVQRLKRKGHLITRTGNTTDAELLLRVHVYDLLLIDLRLPTDNQDKVHDTAGLQLVANLLSGRLGELNSRTPSVLISAQAFRIDALLEKFDDRSVAEQILDGRVFIFQKGDTMLPLLDYIENATKNF